MPIQFKSKLSSAIANATWLDKTIDDATVGKFSLREDSSAHIEDIQLFLNTLRSDVNSNDIELSDHETRISDNETLLIDHETRIGTNETNISTNTSDILDINNSLGQPNGIATLEGDGKVPASQLPSYVDDVEEYADLASFPVTGETGKIYVAIDTGKTYRWSGSIYVEISASDVNSVNGQTGVVTITKSDVNLSNVTDDAQLKREAGDINTFAEKVTPIISDIVIIEDSEDSFSKKKVLLANMLGSGGDAGINYISNSQFESDVSDWTGDTNLIISHETVNPLRGDGSLKINKGAVDASTQTVSSLLFTVDDADLAKILTISFDKDFSDANYNDGDAKITITQDPSGTPSVISMNGEDIAGGTSVHYARFQTDSTIKDYRLDIEWVSASADAVEVLIDNVTIAPQVINQGAIKIDMEDRTDYANANLLPVNGGSLVGTYAYYEVGRDADEILIRARFNTSVAGSGAGVVEFPVPDGLSAITNYQNIGVSQCFNVNFTAGNQFRTAGTAMVGLQGMAIVNQGSGGFSTGAIFLGSSQVYLQVRFKIQGWSSQANMSSDFGGREISTTVTAGTGQVLGNNVYTTIDFTGVAHDSVSAANLTGNYIEVKETGYYDSSALVTYNSNGAGARLFRFAFDGVGDNANQSARLGTTSINPDYQEISFTSKYIERGTQVSVEVFQNTGGALTLQSFNNLTLAKRATPQTSLESETVAARYRSDSGQNFSSGSYQVVNYEDIDYDSHGGYNTSTGVYTFTRSGKFLSSAKLALVGLNAETGDMILETYFNGVGIDNDFNAIQRGGLHTRAVNTVLDVNVGDTLSIRVFQSNGAGRAMYNQPAYNTFSIARIK